MKLKFAHVCDSTILSQERKLSVIGIFDRVFVPGLPTVHGHFDLVLCLETDEEDSGKTIDVDIRLIDPEARPIRSATGKAEVAESTPPGQKLQLIVGFDVVHFQALGRHALEVSVAGNVLESLPLDVEALRKPNAGQA